jgi:hypothetical protein
LEGFRPKISQVQLRALGSPPAITIPQAATGHRPRRGTRNLRARSRKEIEPLVAGRAGARAVGIEAPRTSRPPPASFAPARRFESFVVVARASAPSGSRSRAHVAPESRGPRARAAPSSSSGRDARLAVGALSSSRLSEVILAPKFVRA